jgi:hypothetical protein
MKKIFFVISLAALLAPLISTPLGAAGPTVLNESQITPDFISNLISDQCGKILGTNYNGGKPGHTDQVITSYAHCVIAIFEQEKLLTATFTTCHDGPLAPNPSKSQFLECVGGQILEQKLSRVVGALMEACDTLPDKMPAACTASGYCTTCPPLPLSIFLETLCRPDQSGCPEVITGVEHIETALDAVCEGTITLHDPGNYSNEGGVRIGAGTLEVFFWHIDYNSTFEPEDLSNWEYECYGTPSITGHAWGGFMRRLSFENDRAGRTICEYDGFIEDHCRGSFMSVENQMDADFFFPSTGERPPIRNLSLEHEAGFSFNNTGQGSTRAFAFTNPDPAEIPGKITHHQINWTVIDERTPPQTQSQTAPGPWTLLVFTAMALFLLRYRRAP